MKKQTRLITTLLIFGVLLLSTNLVSAAPLPITIALNHETKECSYYWPGDEFYYWALPPGWEGYGYTCGGSNNSSICTFVTELGNFSFIREEFPHGMWYNEFCNETGYTYIEGIPGIEHGMTDWYKQWLEEQNSHKEDSVDYTWLFIIIAACIVLLSIFIFFRLKKKSGSS